MILTGRAALMGALVLATGLATCVNPDVSPIGIVSKGAQLAITSQPGGAVSGAVLATQPIVEVRDEANNLVPASDTITAAIDSGSGALSGTVAVRAKDGVATFSDLVVAGTGPHTLRFTSAALPTARSNSFRVAETAETPSALAIQIQPAGASSSLPFSTQPVVQIVDIRGLPITSGPSAALVVMARIASGPGTLRGTTSVNAMNGVAMFADLGISGVGTHALAFSIPSPSVQSVSKSFVVAPGEASSLVIAAQPRSANSGVNFSPAPVIELRDVDGNLTTSKAPVSVAIVSGGGTLLGSTTVNAVNGAARFDNLRVSGSGAHVLTFFSQPVAGAPANAALVDALSDPFPVTQLPARLSVSTQPGGATSGSPFASQPAVQILDNAGLVVENATLVVTAARTSGTGSLFGTAIIGATGGTARFLDLGIIGTGSHTLTFSAVGVGSATSNVFAVGASTLPATQLVITTQPSGPAPSGAPFVTQPVVRIRDANGNPVADSGVVVSAAIASGGGTLVGNTQATTNAAGVATFGGLGVSGLIGLRTLDFSGSALSSATSNPVPVSAGAPSQLTVTVEPSSFAQVATPLTRQPVAQVRDAAGNVVRQGGVVVTASIASSAGGTLTAATAISDSAGVATFSGLAITGLVGSRRLTLNALRLSDATTAPIDLAVGPPSRLAITAFPSAAQNGVPFLLQPIVALRDAGDNPVSQSGVSISAAIASGGGTLVGTKVVSTDVNGAAAFGDLSITGTIGNRTVSFAALPLTGVTSGPVALSAGVATKLAVRTQPSSVGVTGVPLSQQPAVQLQDVSSNAVAQAGVDVAVAIASGGGALSGATTQATDVTGAAVFSDLAISGVDGVRTLTFAAGSLTGATTTPISIQSGAACGSSGGGATITSISREAGSTAGGLLVQISGSGFQPADCIRFGAVNATGVTLLTSTVLQAVVPAGAAGTVDVSVTQNGTTSTLPKVFTYVPAATTTIATADFEAGTLSPFTTATGASITTLQARSGTRAVLHRFSASATQNSLSFNLGNNNYPVTSANGLWMRWFFYVPAATVNALSSGQIKLHFARIFNSGGAPIGGWLELGIGPEISTAANQLRAVVDQTPSNPPLGANFPYAANTWYEVVLHYQRNTSTSMGTAQMWIGTGGTLKYQGSVTHAALGTNGATDNSGFNLGIYSQNASAYPIDVFSDDVTIADGWIGP